MNRPVLRRAKEKATRVTLLLWVFLALLSGVSSVSANAAGRDGAPASAARLTGLRVAVTSLPNGVSAKITISGRRGLRRSLTATGRLKLPPGRYTLSAASVSSGSGMYYATVPTKPIRVRTGHLASATVSYKTFVPSNTKAVTPSDTVALEGEPTGPRTLTLTGPAAATVADGQFLASGESSAAPDGYLVKVISVRHEGERAILGVENATLLEAMPSGEINVERDLQPQELTASIASSRRSGPTARSAEDEPCKGSSGLEVMQPQVSIDPTLEIHVHWGIGGFPPLPRVEGAKVVASVHEKLTMSAHGDAKIECETKAPGIALLKPAKELPRFTVWAGPIPLVFFPRLQVYFSASASDEAQLDASLDQEASAEVGVDYNNGSYHPIKQFHNSFKPSANVQGKAEAEVALRPTIENLLYGVAGIDFDLGLAAKVHAEAAAGTSGSSEHWDLEGCIQGGVALSIDPLDDYWGNPKLIEHCWKLLSGGSGAAGAKPGASNGSGSGGGSGGKGPGAGEKGELCKKYETKGFETKCVLK